MLYPLKHLFSCRQWRWIRAPLFCSLRSLRHIYNRKSLTPCPFSGCPIIQASTVATHDCKPWKWPRICRSVVVYKRRCMGSRANLIPDCQHIRRDCLIPEFYFPSSSNGNSTHPFPLDDVWNRAHPDQSFRLSAILHPPEESREQARPCS